MPGLITSTISVAYGLSFAARSSLPFVIAEPDGATVAVTATLVVALLGRLSAEGAPDELLAPVMIVMALSAALTGLLFFGLGVARAGGRHPLHPLPCHRRLSRCHRLADAERGRARDHRSQPQSVRHGKSA